MKRIAALLLLMACAQAHAQIQTWSFQGAQLFADDGADAWFTGPAGALTGHFDYDTSTGTVRFAANKPLPATLVKKLVKARIAENASLAGKSK